MESRYIIAAVCFFAAAAYMLAAVFVPGLRVIFRAKRVGAALLGMDDEANHSFAMRSGAVLAPILAIICAAIGVMALKMGAAERDHTLALKQSLAAEHEAHFRSFKEALQNSAIPPVTFAPPRSGTHEAVVTPETASALEAFIRKLGTVLTPEMIPNQNRYGIAPETPILNLSGKGSSFAIGLSLAKGELLIVKENTTEKYFSILLPPDLLREAALFTQITSKRR
ncbi:MAG: hypothetical protein QM755_02965 [Luteolibacter sp.]